MPLRLKGDPPKPKKRKRVDDGGSEAGPSKSLAVQQFSDDEADEGWQWLVGPEAATGPIYLTIASPIDPSVRLALSANAVTQRVSVQPVRDDAIDPTELVTVWVCTRVPDSSTKVTLRASTGRYLAADPHGVISAEREARGEQEEWEIEAVKAGFALKTRYGQYVAVDEVAGGRVELRADSATADSANERFAIRMQRVYRNEMAKRRLAEKRQLGSSLGSNSRGGLTEGLTIVKDFSGHESSLTRKFQAPGTTKQLATSKEDVRNLSKAQRDGRLGEELLDRRSKLKRDKFC